MRDGRITAYYNRPIKIVNGFSYVTVLESISVYKMSEDMAIKAKRVFIHLPNSFDVKLNVPYKIFFTFFHSKVCSFFIWCRLWCLKHTICIENIQNYGLCRYI